MKDPINLTELLRRLYKIDEHEELDKVFKAVELRRHELEKKGIKKP